jgi:hypothetical protein
MLAEPAYATRADIGSGGAAGVGAAAAGAAGGAAAAALGVPGWDGAVGGGGAVLGAAQATTSASPRTPTSADARVCQLVRFTATLRCRAGLARGWGRSTKPDPRGYAVRQ